MKILNKEQLRAADRKTIETESIKSIDLMERAAIMCVNWLEDYVLDDTKKIHVFCGVGNNGGDGLAIARHLFQDAFLVSTYLVHFSNKMSDDFITNFKRAEAIELTPVSIYAEDDFPEISENDIVIDAIFGIGLSKPVMGFTKALIHHINKSGATIYAIDVPSGLFIDMPVEDKEAVIQAAMTLTFQTPKLGLLLPDNQIYVDDFSIIDIGLDMNYINQIASSLHYMLPDDLAKLWQKRKKFSHKGNFGHALIIGGSFGKIGAVVLATKAALKIGSGLVTAFIPKCGYQILQTAVPEAMVEVDAENNLEFFNYKTSPTVIGIGVGMGTSEKTVKAFGRFLKENTLPLVLDADALNIISKNPSFLDYLPENCIITPHPKELERLIGTWNNDYDKMEMIKVFSKKHKLIVVLKGAHSLIVQDDQLYFNSSGTPALATAGSGDVLTGIITGLVAQNYTPLHATLLGVFLHGNVANIMAQFNNQSVLIASEIIQLLPQSIDALLTPEMEDDGLLIDDSESDDYLDDLFFDDDFDAPY